MEYEGLLAGLRAAIGLDIDKIIIKGDSQLVIKQVNKEYASPQMEPYVEEVWKLQRRFNSFRAVYVPRNENKVADEVSQLASIKIRCLLRYTLRCFCTSLCPSRGPARSPRRHWGLVTRLPQHHGYPAQKEQKTR